MGKEEKVGRKCREKEGEGRQVSVVLQDEFLLFVIFEEFYQLHFYELHVFNTLIIYVA